MPRICISRGCDAKKLFDRVAIIIIIVKLRCRILASSRNKPSGPQNLGWPLSWNNVWNTGELYQK